MKRKVLMMVSFMTMGIMAAYAQSSGNSVVFRTHSMNESVVTPDVALYTAPAAHYKEIEVYHFQDWKLSDGNIATYKPYKRTKAERNTGIGLLAGGGAGLIIGAALVGDGVSFIKRNGGLFGGNDDIRMLGHFYETYFGAFFLAQGIGMTIPGAVIFARASKKLKKIETQWADEHRKK